MQRWFTLERCIILIQIGLLAWLLWRQWRPRLKRLWQQHVKPRLRRRWKPKAPEDCPACQPGVHWAQHPIRRDVMPYAQRKSRRGRRKSIDTHGWACLNPAGYYFGITD